MSALRVDIRVPVGRPIPELVGFIRRVEAAGLTGVGVHDHHHSGRDAYVTLALAAAQTRRLSLYPATSNPLTRHPLVLAALGNSLAELAPGRTMLTLGPGLLSVEAAGLGRARREVLRRAVRQIKALLGGEAVAFNGTPTRLRYPAGVRVPVLLLASGPRLIELAGEVADGVMMLVGLNQASVAAARAHLAAVARSEEPTWSPAPAGPAETRTNCWKFSSCPSPWGTGRRCAGGPEVGSDPVSRGWPTRAGPISTGSGWRGSTCPTILSRKSFQTAKPTGSARPWAFSGRRNTAPSG